MRAYPPTKLRLPNPMSKVAERGPLRWDNQDPVFLQRAQPLIDMVVATTSSGGTVLDVGCGDGWITAQIAKKIPETVGIDADIACVSVARAKGVTADCISVYDIRLTGPFDVVVMADVFEHLPWPEHAMMNLARITKRVILTTPEPLFCEAPSNDYELGTRGDGSREFCCPTCGSWRKVKAKDGVCGRPNYRLISPWHATEYTEQSFRKKMDEWKWSITHFSRITEGGRINFLVELQR